ncbi:MAG: hypothetical protein WCV67_05255 [Victivallaceae bacterium]|jgi:hypothetical protein
MRNKYIKLTSMALAATMVIFISGCGKKAAETAPAVNNNTVAFQQAVDNFLQVKSYGLKATRMDILKDDSAQAVVSCVVTNSSRKWEFTLKKDSGGAWTVTTFEQK